MKSLDLKNTNDVKSPATSSGLQSPKDPATTTSRSSFANSSPRIVEMSPMPSAKTTRSVKINKICKKEINKLKHLHRDKTQRFEDRMKIFENVDTFIDIKDYLQKMNTVNYNLKSSNSLPTAPMKKSQTSAFAFMEVEDSIVIRTPKGSSKTVPPTTFDSRIDFRNSPDNMKCSLPRINTENEVDSICMDMVGSSSVTASVASTTNIDFNKTIENARRHVSKKDKKNYCSEICGGLGPMMVRPSMHLNEEPDPDEFYNRLDENLAKDRCKREDELRKSRENQEGFNYQLDRLKITPVQEEVNEEFYKEYKLRADKITNLLKHTSRKIYNKKIQAEIKAKKQEAQTQETKCLLKDLQPKFDSYLNSERFLRSREQDVDLGSHFKRMETKVNELASKPLRGWSMGPSIATPSTRSEVQTRGTTSTSNSEYNQKVNRIHNRFMSSLINQALLEETKCKTVKNKLEKEMNDIEEITRSHLLEKVQNPLQSIKISPTEKQFSLQFYRKDLHRNFSKNLIVL